ncbi:hypothetical protein [Nocardia niigatensis]|uniref:hypothetical protein n=1 Tax=Nocardia niigatensis TaxID=209249 RepID=UPI0012F691B2|nr:hypothetical protein [Nocardia niigatensis]
MAVTIFLESGPFTYISIMNQCSGVPVTSAVTAEEYLRFAKSDLEMGTTHGLINAMGNAKRSLHLMIDTVLQSYGLLAQGKRRSFPDKLRLMDDVGLIALNVFRKLNVERNVMEHEYMVPDLDRVQDFVDVCHLLLLATERLGQDLPYRSIVGLRSTGEHMLLELEPMAGTVNFRPLLTPTVMETEAFDRDIEYVARIWRDEGPTPNAESIGDVVQSIALRPKDEAEWIPIVRSLVAVGNDLSRSRSSAIKDGMMTIQTAFTFPVASADGLSLADLIRERLAVLSADQDEEKP